MERLYQRFTANSYIQISIHTVIIIVFVCTTQVSHSDEVSVWDVLDQNIASKAEQGDARAQNQLGVMYFNGAGVRQDKAEAAMWLRKAAEQGFESAQYNLGVMYFYGAGVRQDKAEAAMWFRKAAEQGNAEAQNKLGLMYVKGDGVRQDRSEAGMWFRRAAEQGDVDASEYLRKLMDEESLHARTNTSHKHDVTGSKEEINWADVGKGMAEIIKFGMLFSGSQGHSTENSIRENNSSESSCYQQAQERITKCSLLFTGCDSTSRFSCHYKASCDDSNGCETALEANGPIIGYGAYYCDKEDRWNYSKNLDAVLESICSE